MELLEIVKLGIQVNVALVLLNIVVLFFLTIPRTPYDLIEIDKLNLELNVDTYSKMKMILYDIVLLLIPFSKIYEIMEFYYGYYKNKTMTLVQYSIEYIKNKKKYLHID